MKASKIFKVAAMLCIGTLVSLATGFNPVLGAAGAYGAGKFVDQLAGYRAPQTQAAFTVTSIGDTLWGDGDDNMGGVRTIAYLCLHSDVASDGHRAPATRAAATTLSQLSIISSDLGFKAGKGWKKVYTTEDKGFVESVMQGEKDGKSWYTKCGLHFPGNGARINGLMRLIQNAGVYVLAKDAEGNGRLIGSEFYPGKLDTSTITTQPTAAGLKGVMFEVGCSSPYPAPVFTAEPDLEESESA